jgi:cobalamin biosynthesis protein CobW
VAAGLFADDPQARAKALALDPRAEHDQPLAELFEDQINCADLIILNKSDQMDENQRQAAEAAIRAELKRKAPVLLASHGAIGSDILLGLRAGAEDDLEARHSHHEAEGEDHDHDEFESFHVALSTLRRPEDILNRLLPLAREHDILRVKGFLDVAGKDMRLVVQGVGERFQHYYDRRWGDDEPRQGRLVIIGMKGLDRSGIERALRD